MIKITIIAKIKVVRRARFISPAIALDGINVASDQSFTPIGS